MRRTLFYAAEVCEPRSSVSPSAYAVRMDVTVSTLKVVGQADWITRESTDGPDSQDHDALVKADFSVLLCPLEPLKPPPMMVDTPKLNVKCFLSKTLKVSLVKSGRYARSTAEQVMNREIAEK